MATTAQSSALIKNWFILLVERGKFWFSAQVYSSKENDLSYHDATISYDPMTNSFRARYTSYGEPEEGISWDIIRVPQTDNLPHNIHISDCLDDLQPGDHVEVHWRISKRNPYGLLFHYVTYIYE